MGEGPGKYKRTEKHRRLSSLINKKNREAGWQPGSYERTAEHRLAVTLMNRARLREGYKAYAAQKKMARVRSIEFLLTYEEWLDIWKQSGHWHERGHRKGQYVMSRPKDRGPYASWNVKIVTVAVNNLDRLGVKRGPYKKKSIDLNERPTTTR